MLRPLFTLLYVLVLKNSFAQPRDAEIKKQLTNPNTISIGFTKSTGTRQWNSSVGNWEYVRGVIMKQKSFEYPKYKVNIGGDAVYQDMGGGKYSYKKFRLLYQSFEGIPKPDFATVKSVVSKNWNIFYGANFKNIIKLIKEPALGPDNEWVWHTPQSVNIPLVYEAEIIAGNNSVETCAVKCIVRMYRNTDDGEWDRYIQYESSNTVIAKTEVSPEEMATLQTQTLYYTIHEDASKATNAALPAVTVPLFSSAAEMATFLHLELLNGDSNRVKSVLLQVLNKQQFFVPGSSVQLNDIGKLFVKNVLTNAYKGKYKYSDQYCPQPELGSLTSANHIYFKGVIPKVTTQISAVLITDGYINGQPIKKWKLTRLDITVRQDNDAVQQLQSITNPKVNCK